jgi:hypothetical protein
VKRRRLTLWVALILVLCVSAWAAITEADLAENTSTTDATSFTTASQTPSANQLILACTSSCVTSAEPNEPTITANGLTWVNVGTALYWKSTGGTQRCKSTLFRAMGGSPSAGTALIDFAGQTQAVAGWSFSQYDGVDTSGTNGSGAVRNVVTNSATGVTALTVTLAAFASANNGTFGCFAKSNDVEHFVAGSGFSLIFSGIKSSPAFTLGAEWRADNDTTVDMTWTTSSTAGGIALEIVAAGGATGKPLRPPIVMGGGAQ